MLATADTTAAAPPLVGTTATTIDIVRGERKWMATSQDTHTAATLHVIVIVTVFVIVLVGLTPRDVVHDARDGGLLLGDQL